MKQMKYLFTLLLFLCLLMPTAFGQRDGISTFSAADVHDNDVVDLVTLAPSINVPLISKPGAFPFSYTLTSKNLCYIAGSGAHSFLNCRQGSRFGGFIPGMTGTTIVPTLANNILCNGNQVVSQSGFVLFTSDGLDGHPINPNIQLDACHTSFTEYTTDGSGYLIEDNFSGGATVTAPNGHTATFVTGPPSDTDPFGNSISILNNKITDTLGAVITQNLGSFGSNGTTDTEWIDTTGAAQKAYFTFGSALTFSTTGSKVCGNNDSQITMYPLAALKFPDSTYMSFGMEQGSAGAGTTTGRIAWVKLRTGITINYTYSDPCTFLTTGAATLTRSTPDGDTTYSTSLSGGIATTTVLDPGKNKSVYVFSKSNAYATVSFLLGEDFYQNTGTVSSPAYKLLKSITVCYNNQLTSCRSAAPTYPITQRDIYTQVDSMSATSRVKETFDQKYGVRTGVANYDFGASTATTWTNTTYGTWNSTKGSCVAISATINDHPCQVATYGSSNVIGETHYSYNSLGAPTATLRYTGSQWLSTTFVPNANGTVASTTNENGAQTTYGYSGECNSLFSTSSSVSPNVGGTLTTSTDWDCNGGVITDMTDVNGNVSHYTYDPLFRKWTYTDPSGYFTQYEYVIEPVRGFLSTGFTSSASFGSSTQNNLVYPDGFGRPILIQAEQGPSAAVYDSISYAYGFNGPTWTVSSSSPCAADIYTNCSVGPKSSTTFDPLGRPILSTDYQGGSLSYAYSSGSNHTDTSMTLGPAAPGEALKTTQREYDGFGRLTSVCTLESAGGTACGQADGHAGILTTYAYTYSGGETHVAITRGVQTHTTIYDALGRIKSINTPETGLVLYYWDAAPDCGSAPTLGDMLETKSNSGLITCYWYDNMHRMESNQSKNDTSEYKAFAYDSTSNQLAGTPPSGATFSNTKGRLIEARTGFTDEWFSYDQDGHVTDVWESTPHSNGWLHTSSVYNPNGVPTSLSGIPGYSTFNFGVDGEGRLNTASEGSTTFVNGVTYDTLSNPTMILVGTTGDNDSYTYDHSGKMTSYIFSVNGVTDHGTLTWNQNGTLAKLAITDGFNSQDSQTCTFSYDDTARLSTDNCGSSLWNQSYTYDDYDNLSKDGNPGTSWEPGYIASNNRMAGSTYDNDGRLTYDGTKSYTWNAYGKLSGVASGTSQPICGSVGSCLLYDALDHMVENNNLGTITVELYTPLGDVGQVFDANTTKSIYMPLPGGAKVLMSPGTPNYFVHPDWLGTKRLGTDLSARTTRYDAAYTPYGETYAVTGNLTSDFTGDPSNMWPGLYDTPNRNLANNASRWLSPDPAHASWNAYAYVTNPNVEVDPSGLAGYQVGTCGSGWNSCSAVNIIGLDGSDNNFGESDPLTELTASFIQDNSPMSGVIDFFAPGGGDEITSAFGQSPNTQPSTIFDSTGTLWLLPLSNMVYNWFDMKAGCSSECQAEQGIQPAADPIGNIMFSGNVVSAGAGFFDSQTGMWTIRSVVENLWTDESGEMDWKKLYDSASGSNSNAQLASIDLAIKNSGNLSSSSINALFEIREAYVKALATNNGKLIHDIGQPTAGAVGYAQIDSPAKAMAQVAQAQAMLAKFNKSK